MHMKMCIHYSTRRLLRKLTSDKICCVCYCIRVNTIHYGFNFRGDQIFVDFITFLIHDIILFKYMVLKV